MNGRTFAGILLTLLLIAGAATLGITAYNAGVAQGLVQSGQVVVAPGYPVGPYIGGWGGSHGFGFFGFLGALFFLFLIFGLMRAAFGGGRGWGGRSGRGWDGRGWDGPGGPGRGPWSDRAREFHDELHRASEQPAADRSDQPRA